MLTKGLEQTRGMFEPVRELFAGVHAVAHALGNSDEKSAAGVRQDWEVALTVVAIGGQRHESLAGAARHFERVSRSYESGLFHCYGESGLPRTNNDLEHVFGQMRHHERRATGRKAGNPNLVVRGRVRLLAAVVTRVQAATAADLVPGDRGRLADMRAELEHRREQRRMHRRFRRNPDKYLKTLEDKLPQRGLPS